MSEWIAIQKTALRELTSRANDKVALAGALEKNHDPDQANEFGFLILPLSMTECPQAYVAKRSLDWEMHNALEYHLAHNNRTEEQNNEIRATVYAGLIGKLISIILDQTKHWVESASPTFEGTLCPGFGKLDGEEKLAVLQMLVSARGKAADMNIDLYQLILDGRVTKLLPDDPNVKVYENLTQGKKDAIHSEIIRLMRWETLYPEIQPDL